MFYPGSVRLWILAKLASRRELAVVILVVLEICNLGSVVESRKRSFALYLFQESRLIATQSTKRRERFPAWGKSLSPVAVDLFPSIQRES
jgi:hypothetical protein